MNACLLNVLHDAADQYTLTITDGIHIDFYSIVKEAIQQDRRIVRNRHRRLEITLQVYFVVDDFHRTSAQHVRGTDHQRITNPGSFFYRLLQGGNGGVGRLLQVQAVNGLLEAFAVFCPINRIRAGPDDRYASGFQCASQFQRRLTTVLHNHPFRFFDADDFQHVFKRYRLEVKAVRGVIIRGDGFRVTVHHDGFETVFAQCQCRMNTTVVKLNALADTVWSTTQHHDLVTILVRIRFALFLIGRVHIGCIGREFCRAGIHPLVNRMQIVMLT